MIMLMSIQYQLRQGSVHLEISRKKKTNSVISKIKIFKVQKQKKNMIKEAWNCWETCEMLTEKSQQNLFKNSKNANVFGEQFIKTQNKYPHWNEQFQQLELLKELNLKKIIYVEIIIKMKYQKKNQQTELLDEKELESLELTFNQNFPMQNQERTSLKLYNKGKQFQQTIHNDINIQMSVLKNCYIHNLQNIVSKLEQDNKLYQIYQQYFIFINEIAFHLIFTNHLSVVLYFFVISVKIKILHPQFDYIVIQFLTHKKLYRNIKDLIQLQIIKPIAHNPLIRADNNTDKMKQQVLRTNDSFNGREETQLALRRTKQFTYLDTIGPQFKNNISATPLLQNNIQKQGILMFQKHFHNQSRPKLLWFQKQQRNLMQGQILVTQILEIA